MSDAGSRAAAESGPAAKPRKRKSLIRRILKWVLIVLLVLVLVLLGLIAWIAGTRSGLDFAWSLAQPRLPEGIEVATVEGRLIGPLTITGIEVDNPSMHVAVGAIELEWEAAALLSRTVHIENLAVRNVDYAAKAGAPEPEPKKKSEPFSLPEAIELPVAVQLDRFALDDVALVTAPDAEPFLLDRARLTGARLGETDWHIESLTAHGPMFDIDARARIAPRGRYATELAVDAELRLPDLAPVKTKLRVAGDLDRLTLEQTVAAPYNVALDATLTDVLSDAPAGPLAALGIEATLTLDDTRLTAIRADLPDLAPITTELRVAGDMARLSLEQTVAAPYNAALEAVVTDVLADAPDIEATLALDDTRLQAIRADLPETTVSTEIAVSGTPDDLSVTLDARADSADFGKAVVAAALHYSPQAVEIERLLVTSPDMPGRLSAQGQVALSEGNAMDLTLNWQQLQWPLTGAPAYRSENGEIRLTGTLSDYQLDGNLSWQVVGQTAGRLQLAGSGDMNSFKLANLSVSGGPGDISAQANVVWAPALDVSAHVEGEHINPGAVVPDVPGDFSLVADIRAQQTGKVITAHVDTLQARGTLRGQPLRLDAQAAYLGDHVVIEQLDLNYGATTVAAEGRLGWTPDSALDLTWDIDSTDLSSLWPTLAGELHTTGAVRGTVSAPRVEAELTANNLEYTDTVVDAVDLDADVDWSGASQSRVALDVADARVAGQVINALALRLTGTPAAHELDVTLDSETAQLDLALDGGLRKETETWRFTLTRLNAAYGELAPWTLPAPASGQVSASAQSIEQACLTSGEARLCVAGAHDPNGTIAEVALSDLAFAYAEPFLPDTLIIDGAMSATVDARLPASGTPDIEMHLTTTAGSVKTVQADESVVPVLAFEPARVDVTLANTQLDAALALPLADTGAINAEVAVAAGSAPLTERPLAGNVDIRIAQLDFVAKLVPEVAEIEGRIVGDMRIDGTIAQPRVLGEIALNASRIVLVTPGLELTDVTLAAVGRGEAIDISASAKSGGGRLTVDGAIAFAPAGPTIDLAIEGEQFQAVNTPDARVWISPDLDVGVTPEAVRVTGSLTIPKAEITPRNLPEAGVETVSSDTVIVTEETVEDTAVAREVYADITVILGDVRIESFGLKAALEGQLRVMQAPGEPTTGTGEIRIPEGEYRAYGQNLDIQRGRIIFAGGPVSQPGLDLRAARYPTEEITVGVEVRGSLSSPTVTLFSDPVMSQAEILSWLLLGRPLEGTTGGQSSLIARAALALGTRGGNTVLDEVGDKLGVDDIGIGSPAGTGSSEAAFMVGKYLTPKLYVSYGLGIFDSVSTLSLRYSLSSRWSLETQTTGTATGGDLIYTIER